TARAGGAVRRHAAGHSWHSRPAACRGRVGASLAGVGGGDGLMPRVCTVCAHPDRGSIDRALVHHATYRHIAAQYGLASSAIFRHREDHVPAQLAQAQAAAEVAQADDLLAQVRALRSKALSILLKAEQQGDYRTALVGIREARSCLELLLEVEG